MFVSKLRQIYYAYFKSIVAKQESYFFKDLDKNLSNVNLIVEKLEQTGATITPRIFYKLYSLQALLEEKKPNNILELGTGASTLVFLKYLESNSAAKLTCLDESDKWLDNTKKIANSLSLNCSNAQFIRAPKKPLQSQSPAGVGYDYDLSQDSYDFVFIDGPSWEIKPYYNTDIFELCKSTMPDTIVIDQRVETVERLVLALKSVPHEERLSDLFSFELIFGKRAPFSLLKSVPKLFQLAQSIQPSYNYFSIFLKPK